MIFKIFILNMHVLLKVNICLSVNIFLQIHYCFYIFMLGVIILQVLYSYLTKIIHYLNIMVHITYMQNIYKAHVFH